jgi:hypothetical protein
MENPLGPAEIDAGGSILAHPFLNSSPFHQARERADFSGVFWEEFKKRGRKAWEISGKKG